MSEDAHAQANAEQVRVLQEALAEVSLSPKGAIFPSVEQGEGSIPVTGELEISVS
ncbi:hypothetical protein [Deinococcus hopiensis]|uniref:Uncharacterized protein n=1 Tax=Deinococcus hopiensis KR-140 TaxID=695939 RepID=A0A1W1VCD0_9DEIO|nr:hypothetical protein [Deinococcus hopiensis]SMB91117.1 hypothetical protein SAMN00790413_00992 [Deinococcus hopiensis KR-140]